MDICKKLVAKSNNGRTLSLYQHLIDTVDVMEYLIVNYVSPAVVYATNVSYEDFRCLAIFIAATHDIGKATNAFQQKIVDSNQQHYSKLQQYGIRMKKTGLESKSPHNLAGAVILNQYCNVDDSICEIIAAHHGKPRDKGKTTKFTYQLKQFAKSSESSPLFPLYFE